MSEYILQTDDLTKTYGRKQVVNHVNLKIRKGDIYGFIGKNGAGKTTTIKLIVGLCGVSSGKIELFGNENLGQGRKKIGTVIESPAFYPYMTARQNIEAQRILKGIKDKSITEELLNIVGLGSTGSKKAKNFSLGMKQRLAIALALVGDPEFLILDEPINGLDPAGIKEVRDLIVKLNKEAGITVLISSHILGELSKMATCYGVINDGELVGQFTKEELEKEVRPFIKLTVNDPEKAMDVLTQELKLPEVVLKDNNIFIYGVQDDSVAINAALSSAEIIIQSISLQSGDYEDYFIKLMEGGKSNG